MTMLLAGHAMIDRGHGLVCEGCGKTWQFLLDNRDRWQPGQLGLAHNDSGTIGLNAKEVESMERYIEHIWACIG